MNKNTIPEASFYAATEGATTQQGGEIKQASSNVYLDGYRVARVGDAVSYPNGTVSIITSGAENGFEDGGKAIALIGSRLENGDKVINNPAGLKHFMSTV